MFLLRPLLVGFERQRGIRAALQPSPTGFRNVIRRFTLFPTPFVCFVVFCWISRGTKGHGKRFESLPGLIERKETEGTKEARNERSIN